MLPRRGQSLTNRLRATERRQCPCNAAESRGSCTFTVWDHLVCSRLASCFLRTSKKFCPFGILCDVPLPGGRQSQATCVQIVLKIPLAPHTPLLLLGTESPSTLWYTAGFSWSRSQQLFRSRAPLHSSCHTGNSLAVLCDVLAVVCKPGGQNCRVQLKPLCLDGRLTLL